ncbi:MAG: hypothetical protein RLZZ12_686 [Actinomycetota bacterium]
MSQFSAKQAPFKAHLKALALALALLASSALPAGAHQPVFLTAESARIPNSPVLVEGSISFAVTASFSKVADRKHFRFALREGEALKLEYLILDRRPENRLKKSKLPVITVTSPSGKKLNLKINERTEFYEPYGRQNYLFLSRVNQSGESGIYSVKLRARAKASVLVAVGGREVRGEVMQIGTKEGTCPAKLNEEIEISEKRAAQLIGLSERAGELCATLNDWGYRVVQRDGEDFAVTMDYRSNRINVKVKDDKIFEVTVG